MKQQSFQEWCEKNNTQLLVQWNLDKNSGINPTTVTVGSHKKVWWVCSKGHEWEAEIKTRTTEGTGCPFCSNHKVLSGYNDLSSQYPQIAVEWHPTKNGNLTPKDVLFGSHKKVWWLCPKGHEWNAVIYQRCKGVGCPVCSNKLLLPGFNDLETINPDLASEWHPTKNGELKPSDLMANSRKDVWWLGKCGHEWHAFVYSRNVGNGCPICNNQMQTSFSEKAISYYLEKHLAIEENYRPPHLNRLELDVFVPSHNVAIEYDGAHWHDYNRDLKKNAVCLENKIRLIRVREKGCPPITGCTVIEVDGTDKSLDKAIVEIIQSLGIQPSANEIDSRRDSGLILSKQRIQFLNDSLESKYPDIAKTWHPKLNGSLLPCQISAYSNKKVWWLCPKGHEWNVSVSNRVTKQKCPYCSNKRVIPNKNSLVAEHPEIAIDWDYEKNGILNPSDLRSQSSKKVWWKCRNGHEDYCTVQYRVQHGGCSYCKGNRLTKSNNFSFLYPEIASTWNNEKNGDDSPSNYKPGSNKKVWWKCPKGHEWQSSISNRVRGHACPFCSGRNAITGENDLSTVNPEVAKYWDSSRNDSKPTEVSSFSEKKVWWKCPNGHEWNEKIREMTKRRGCPYCDGRRTLSGYNDLATTNYELSLEWHPTKNGSLGPSDVSQGSNKKVWWLGKCGHEWESSICGRVRGSSCPYCNSRSVLKGFNDLSTTKPELAKEWNTEKNGKLSPYDVSQGSNKKVWWKCCRGHEWQDTVNHRSAGRSCPICKREK